jgi:hypothetical protein
MNPRREALIDPSLFCAFGLTFMALGAVAFLLVQGVFA